MITTINTIFADSKTQKKALGLTRGRYQRSLIEGRARWSGADLQGTAKSYNGKYATSRENLINRLRKSGIPVLKTNGKNNRIVVIFGFKL